MDNIEHDGSTWTPGKALNVGDEFIMQWPRSRWAIIWDRLRHPLTTPARTEPRKAKVIATVNSNEQGMRTGGPDVSKV